MAVIERRRSSSLIAIALLCTALPSRADRASDVRSEVAYVASALASGNPTDALTRFDKSMPDYDKLRDYFDGLTSSYDIASEVEVAEEEDGETETTLKVNWSLTLSDRVNSNSTRQTTEATMRWKQIKKKWRIVSFTPVEMFNPQRRK